MLLVSSDTRELLTSPQKASSSVLAIAGIDPFYWISYDQSYASPDLLAFRGCAQMASDVVESSMSSLS